MADTGALSYLFGGQQPSGVDTSTAQTNGLPTWYQQYLSGIAGKATQIAGDQAGMALPAQSVAGFNSDQTGAFQGVRDDQGSWQPNITAATTAASGISGDANSLIDSAQNSVAGPAQNTAGDVSGYGTSAMGSVAGPASSTLDSVTPYANSAVGSVTGTGTWDSNAANQYMSPYTNDVVNNIQRLGLRNLNENLVPAVQDQFLGSGQFGSTRNADILGRTVRDASTDINGQVANALNSGYTNAQSMFTSDQARAQQEQQLSSQTDLNAGNLVSSTAAADATRQQQQQSLQANTDLGAGNMEAGALSADATRQQQQQQMQGSAALQGAGLSTAADTAQAQQLGALGQTTANLNLQDNQSLGAIGAQQQALQQQGLDASYTNSVNANNFDWSTLNNLNSVVRGLQLPSTVAQSTNSPASTTTPYSGSAVSGVGALTSSLGTPAKV